MDLLARIDDWGRSFHDHPMFWSGGATLSWGDLREKSDALAGAIARAGISSDSPIVVRGHKESEMIIGFLGCAKAGHAYAPIDVGAPEARAQRIIEASGAELVLTPETIRELVARNDPPPSAHSADPSSPHYVMFTSGSTGEPKGVVITRGCLDAFLAWTIDEQQFAPGREVFLNQVIYSFDVSVMDTWTALATGGMVVSLTAADTADFRQLFATLECSGVTTWVSTPALAQLCLGDRRFAASMLPQLRRFMFCGDVLTPDVAGRLLDRFPEVELWNTYGPTEGTVATTSVRVDREMLGRYQQVPIGVAMPGTSVVIEDAEGHQLPEEARGEIVIAGPNVSPGYLGRPDLTARVFSERNGVRTYRTGDWGSVRDGLLFFHGRMDNQVKIAGHRIELGDVEVHLASLPLVRAAAVIAAERNGRPDSLHAFVVLAERGETTDLDIRASLLRELATLLPAYMLPRNFHFLDAFPLTANGKTDRKALAATLTT
ncbi:MAG: D-alanine-activating enzyme [Gemmatimonadetes bacterium]|nr:D-alanine-activating enzyme [Gemmatimonadota bacterium]